METKEKISRRNALKRMSKAALAFAAVSVFPGMSALANNPIAYSNSTEKYQNYDNYKNYGDYNNYTNYENYSNYHNYSNYGDYVDCH